MRCDGVLVETQGLSVIVRSGVVYSGRICIEGEGEAAPQDGATGYLYVQIAVESHVILGRDGANLYCEVPISFVDAVLGGEIEVPTLDGRVKLKVPVETQTGKMFRLRGKGVTPVRGNAKGDLMCKIVVETPINLSGRQKDILRDFQSSLEGKKHSPRQNTWFEGMKDFFN